MIEERKDSTTSYGPQELLKIMILQRRDAVFNELNEYYRHLSAGGNPPLHKLKSVLAIHFINLHAMLDRSLKKESYTSLRKKVYSDNIDTLEEAILEIDQILDRKKVIAVDTIKEYDRSRAEQANIAKNL